MKESLVAILFSVAVDFSFGRHISSTWADRDETTIPDFASSVAGRGLTTVPNIASTWADRDQTTIPDVASSVAGRGLTTVPNIASTWADRDQTTIPDVAS